MGVIPTKLLLVAFIITIGSVGAIGRSLVAGRKDEDPGEKLSLSDHPRLRAVLDEVAARRTSRMGGACSLGERSSRSG